MVTDNVSLAAVDARLNALKEAVANGFATRDEARRLAYETMNNRLGQMNALREQIGAQKAEFVTRLEFQEVRDLVNRAITRADYDIISSHIAALNLRLETSLRESPNRADVATIQRETEANALRITALETRVYLGGAGAVIILTLLQLGINALHLFR